jgi:hypothetical protein
MHISVNVKDGSLAQTSGLRLILIIFTKRSRGKVELKELNNRSEYQSHCQYFLTFIILVLFA